MQSDSPKLEHKAVSLSFRPNVKLVSCVRKFVSELCNSMLKDPDAASRVALTVHELLENTLKYSTDGHAAVDVVVTDQNGQTVLKVNSTSRGTASQLQEVGRRIDDLRGLNDPMQQYINMMMESAMAEEGSGLGLIRIRVEGQMELTYSVQDDLITISAVTPIERNVI